jgi:hypothetical protein
LHLPKTGQITHQAAAIVWLALLHRSRRPQAGARLRLFRGGAGPSLGGAPPRPRRGPAHRHQRAEAIPLRKGETGEIDRWRTSRADRYCPQPASGAYAGPSGLTGAAPCKQNWWLRGGRLGPNSERSPDRHTMAAAPRFPLSGHCRDSVSR